MRKCSAVRRQATLRHKSEAVQIGAGRERYRQKSRDVVGVDIRSLKQSTLKALAPKEEPKNMVTSFHILSGDDLRRLASHEQGEAGKGELAVIQAYRPGLADEATTRAWVEAAIAASGADSPKLLGKVMGVLMKEHKGEVDAGLAKQIAGELLSG